MVAGLLLSTLLTVRIAGSIGRNQLVYTSRAESSMTREEALGIAAGAFRGMFVNFLWLRAQDLKQDGKYWEAVDLARTITRLQPRYPRVWAFHAWNLSYNISVTTQTPEERWQWVQAGVRLLRDEAIPANPNDMLLHKELAWIFLHKMQMRMDDANNKYKEWFAREWTIVVGPPPDTVLTSPDRNANIAACEQRLQNIIDAPETMDDMREHFTEAYALAQRIKAETNIDVTTEKGRIELLTAREEYRSAHRREEMLKVTLQMENFSPKLRAMLDDESLWTSGAWDRLLGHLRKRTIVDTYKMEPDRMLRYTHKYGPMDWRHPASHAVYWAARGVEQGLNRVQEQNSADFDFINTDRMVLHAVQELFRTGLVEYDILLPQYMMQLPSIDFIESYDSIEQELAEREEKQMASKGVDMKARAYRFYSEGYENFLDDAVVYLYRRREFDRAKMYQLKIASFPGRNRNNIDRERIRTLNLDNFVAKTLEDRVSTPNVALQEIVGALWTAYIYGLYVGDEETFRQNYGYAASVHRQFYAEQFRLTNVDPNAPRMAVFSVEFPEVAGQYLFEIIRRGDAARAPLIYARAPEDARMFAYGMLDDLAPRDEKGVRTPSAMDKFFPPPSGYAAWRAQREAEKKRRETIRGNQQIK
jgi:hypothetical protein